MIEVAALLSAAVHHWASFAIIFAMLLLNASVGFWQEFKADTAMAAPKDAWHSIAVSGATDAARAAADLVLTASGLSVITAGIEEARRIFERMTSYAIYRIAKTIRVLLFMTLSTLLSSISIL